MSEAPQDANERLAEIDPTLGRGTRFPLSVVLLGVVLFVSIAPLALFAALTTREMRDALVAAQQERQLHLAASVAQQLDGVLDRVGREAVKIAEALATWGEKAPRLGDFLDETVVHARYTPAQDGTAMRITRPGAALGDEVLQALDRDLQSALEHGPGAGAAGERAAMLSGPFPVPGGVLAVAVSATVQRDGMVVGVYQQVAVFRRSWEEAVRSVPAPMRLLLLRADGSVAASSIPVRPGEGRDVARQREVVQQFLGAPGRSQGVRAYEVPASAGQPARRMLGSFAPTGHGWGVFIEVDEQLALAPVERVAELTTFAGVIAAALAVAAALLLGAMITRPVGRLAAVARRLAEGDFEVGAAESRISELDVLALTFNRMAGRLGVLVQRFRDAAREANDMFLGTIRALAEAIDEKDPYTKGHSVRVNRYSVIIGRYLGLSREEMRALQIASLLHDVGKIGIDDAILKKPAALSPEEFAVMRTHTDRGAKIMGRIPQMRDMIAGMRFHHERFQGGGYPLGLRGEEIPLQARIIAVADTLDAMTTDRPYQKAFTPQAAAARINELKGNGLDPQCVEAFNRAYEAGEFDSLFAATPRAPDTVAEGRP